MIVPLISFPCYFPRHRLWSSSLRRGGVLTCPGAAAALRAARAADVTAAGVWAALAPADPYKK